MSENKPRPRNLLDEQEDYLIAVARLEEDLLPVPMEDVVKELGLDD